MKKMKYVMSHDEFENQCWNYYLFLEEKFLHATQFVYLSKYNFTCYSHEFVNLLIITSIEFENIVKIIYRHTNGLDQSEKFNKPICNYYSEAIVPLFKLLEEGDTPLIKLNSQHVSFSPLVEFGKHRTWWSKYNDVKHSKTTNFRKANMWNVLNALSAVFAIDCLFLKCLATTPVDAPVLSSKLFYFENFRFNASFAPMCTTQEILNDLENMDNAL